MRKIATLIFALSSFVTVRSQTMNDGKGQFQRQRYQSAEATFHSIIRTDPSNSEAWAMLMRTYILQKKYGQASDSLALLPQTISEHPFSHVARGIVLLSKNEAIEAKNHFQQALNFTKEKNIPIITTIADVNIESPNGDYGYAVELLQKAVKKDRKNAGLFTSLGQAFRKLHNGSEAYKAFISAIEKNNKETIAYCELGKLFLSQKNEGLYKDYFQKAIDADPHFGPAYYSLYDHYLYNEPSKAKDYFREYVANSDYSVQQEYSFTDLLYLTKNYDSAILLANKVLQGFENEAQPRLYKLISYSYQGKGDSVNALPYMASYFKKEADSNFVQKDFETMARLYSSTGNKEDSAVLYYEKALSLVEEPAEKNIYFKELAKISKKVNQYDREAYWLGQIYSSDPKANNVTLFNWGLAAYKAQDYQQADSVFGLYTNKYPEQGFGYYWRARTNAGIDTAMTQGLAIPHYLNLIEVVAKDTLDNTDRKWMKEAYGYLASYEANTEKDYAEAIGYFEKLLVIDPGNEQAERNIEILEKTLATRNKMDAGSK